MRLISHFLLRQKARKNLRRRAKIWRSANGTSTTIGKMTDTHLINAINKTYRDGYYGKHHSKEMITALYDEAIYRGLKPRYKLATITKRADSLSS